jgi:GntR family transcriptional regulator
MNVDPSSHLPLYQQIVEQIERQVSEGVLVAGARLPSVRDLALELRINPNTVARAYREMERAGLVFTERGRGVFVAEQRVTATWDQEWQKIDQLLDELLQIAVKVDLPLEELIEQLRKRAAAHIHQDEEADS